MTSPALGMLFGFLNTASLHLARGLQRHGIRTLGWFRQPRDERSARHAVIYVAGVALNNTGMVWMVLANRFAAPAYATGMFGLGLVLLLLYSRFVLGEPVRPVNHVGALLVVAGTAVFAVDSLAKVDLDLSAMDPRTVTIVAAGFFLVAAIFVAFADRRDDRRLKGLAFGLAAGGLGGLDPVLKAIGQHAGGNATLLPDAAWGWLPFVASFAFGITAFFTVQFGFHRGADASVLGPMHTCTYILLPVAVQLAALPAYRPTPLLIVGIVVIVAGVVVIQIRGQTTGAETP